jgi:hypothetical protein
MAAKHTPGQWRCDDDTPLRFGDCALSHQVWASSARVAFLESHNVGLITAAVNARLIAAAPELYAIVERIAAHFKDTDSPLGMDAAALLQKIDGEP